MREAIRRTLDSPRSPFGRPRAGVGVGGVLVLDAATWDAAYAGAAPAHGMSGSITVSGLPTGLTADTSGGVLTITGTPT